MNEGDSEGLSKFQFHGCKQESKNLGNFVFKFCEELYSRRTMTIEDAVRRQIYEFQYTLQYREAFRIPYPFVQIVPLFSKSSNAVDVSFLFCIYLQR